MRDGKWYKQFPNYRYAPNGNAFYGVPYKCDWAVYCFGDTPVHDEIVSINNADIEVTVETAQCTFRGTFVQPTRTWAAKFWTRVLHGDPAVEFGVHCTSTDGRHIDVLTNWVLSDVGLWSPGGGFVNPRAGEYSLSEPYRSVWYIAAGPVQRRDELPAWKIPSAGDLFRDTRIPGPRTRGDRA